MKLITLSLLFVLIITACTEKTVEYSPEKPCIIYGQIYNQEVYPHIKQIELKLSSFAGQDEKYIAKIDSSGNFRFEFYPKLKREVQLTSIEDIIVVGPGDSIYVEKDFENVGKTIFKGNHILLNANISRYRKVYLGNYIIDDRMGINEFEEYCDDQKKQFYERLESYKRRYKTDDEFNEWVHLTMELDYYKALIDQTARRQQKSKNDLFIAFNNYYKVNALSRKINNLMNSSYILNSYYHISYSFTLHNIMRYQIRQMLSRKELQKDFPMDYMIDNADDSFLGQLRILNIIHLTKQWNQPPLSSDQHQKLKKIITHPFF